MAEGAVPVHLLRGVPSTYQEYPDSYELHFSW
jgi:hypothetical protein